MCLLFRISLKVFHVIAFLILPKCSHFGGVCNVFFKNSLSFIAFGETRKMSVSVTSQRVKQLFWHKDEISSYVFGFVKKLLSNLLIFERIFSRNIFLIFLYYSYNIQCLTLFFFNFLAFSLFIFSILIY